MLARDTSSGPPARERMAAEGKPWGRPSRLTDVDRASMAAMQAASPNVVSRNRA
jgi:hypothetical protein